MAFAFQQDISERKRAEAALQVSEQHYRLLFSEMLVGFALLEVICDEKGLPVDHRYVEINSAFEKHTGLARDSAVGRTMREVLPGIEPFWIETYGKVATTGESVHFESYAQPLGRWFEVTAFRTLFKTALLKAESETTIDGVLVVDGAGHVVQVNKRFAEMWSLPDDLVGSGDDKKLPESVLAQLKDPGAFLERVEYLYAHENERTRDEIEFADGRVFDRYSAPPRSGQSKHYGRIWYFRDIRQRRRAEETLRASQERYRDLFENASHIIFTTGLGTYRLTSWLGFTTSRLLDSLTPRLFVFIDILALFRRIQVEKSRVESRRVTSSRHPTA